ncbi:bifunctional diguanylate cyclase/phosphohydrolase [Acetobacterium woodii]|uniref:Diguanylate cyclase containing PAS/PAC sensor n=1 Tax=Acetobacterium woodii (strain ATCC 29683 / DSM 1030 / JCM 2381 / KCTC 1655 / WB1) TaxID=931626 RepID=H6LJ02_ACEWD|nr:HD domain-containing phosphohydrolase [Acetobacterium woodii]AFA47365.1 diguanylate cyclase containing PAS/PAC sensor [Acetobacterium woodii DSM 1030]
MDESYNLKNKKKITREAIIGLGENSFKKNYYSELQTKLIDLERINSRTNALIATIPDILLISTGNGQITSLKSSSDKDFAVTHAIMQNDSVMTDLHKLIKQVMENKILSTYYFSLPFNDLLHYFEVRIQMSTFDEVLIMIRDMTERVSMENKLRDLAEKDHLTHLANRRYFEMELEKVNQQSIEQLIILLFDINGLKFINDTLGHLTGDQVIISASQIISQCFSSLGIASRIGGDEFGLIIKNEPPETIENALKNLNSELKSFNQLPDSTFKLSLSYGYSYHALGTVNTDFLFQEADNNMYQNKLLKESSTRNNLVKTLMKALEAKDYVTEGHTNRMDTLATLIGHTLHLPQNIMDRIQLLTKFHDIGKVGIPDSILKKPATLTIDEWKVMKTHCKIGERIANESSELKEISHLILKHHERWDGAGYPIGLAGNNIPIECRVLSIVDSYDAMTNDRPYRAALSPDTAIKEIISCSDAQFDPKLVTIFKQVITQHLRPQ